MDTCAPPMLFVNNSELSPLQTPWTQIIPNEPAVQLLGVGQASCPVLHDHDDSMWKSGSGRQEMSFESGV